MLRTVNNKLQYSYDGEVWNEISEYIAAWFRFQDNKIQISRDQKTWSDLSKPFTQDLYIKGYVATSQPALYGRETGVISLHGRPYVRG